MVYRMTMIVFWLCYFGGSMHWTIGNHWTNLGKTFLMEGSWYISTKFLPELLGTFLVAFFLSCYVWRTDSRCLHVSCYLKPFIPSQFSYYLGSELPLSYITTTIHVMFAEPTSPFLCHSLPVPKISNIIPT